MLALRGLKRIHSVLLQRGNTRSLTVTSHVVQHKDDTKLLEMENPYKEPQTGCLLCNVTVDFKNTQLLSQFVSPHTGRTYGRHITGLCGRKQKEVSKAIKKAHSMGFMSVTHKHPQFMKDPNICGIKHLD
ncbi:28S ribosomal protein S18c, mitochondrial isoform X1 [Pungitius pungitius]|uniref:28S ribosomal protein S18c, mitochondrial isoform X1 n=1 Tax=Pungitius pungitius TaxID=134920 RepID=UPI001886F017|nr:28S ribosomal protein S18c, mitochondrial isoform X1 [Pungitius pungitius]